MKIKLLLLTLSLLTFFIFVIFSYTVAKEAWQRMDFDTTVKIQDRVPRKFDYFFSYFSFLGSAEITISLAGVLALLYLVRLKIWAFWGWLLIIPTSFFEVFGKLFVFHPGPPVLFHRSILENKLPSFYIHTNFSYPSGHITRSLFLVTVFLVLAMISFKNPFLKLATIFFSLILAFLMVFTRIYLGEHWLSDVLGGGLLGISVGLFAAILILPKKSQLC